MEVNFRHIFKFVTCTILFLFTNHLMGQVDSLKKVRFVVEGGFNIGGKISSNNFSYKSGENFQVGFLKPVNTKTDIGFGLGIERLDNDYFYPVSLRIDSKVFKNQNFKLLVRTGYSFGRTESKFGLIDVDLLGGFFMETGRAWNIKVNEKISLSSSISFKYQFAEKKYSFEATEYAENEDFMFLLFKLGIELK